MGRSVESLQRLYYILVALAIIFFLCSVILLIHLIIISSKDRKKKKKNEQQRDKPQPVLSEPSCYKIDSDETNRLYPREIFYVEADITMIHTTEMIHREPK